MNGLIATGETETMDLKRKTEIDDFVSPFKPLMAEGDGSPENLTPDSSFTDLIDLSYSSGIQAETYFGSVFSLVDKQRVGYVRVSKLLDILLSFDDEDDDLDPHNTSDSKTENLEVLKDILDPSDIDPLVNIATFKNAWKKLLKLKKGKCKQTKVSPDSGGRMENFRMKKSNGNGDIRFVNGGRETEGPGRNKVNGADSSFESNKWSVQNTTRRSGGFGNVSRPSLLDLSHLSSRSGSFEGLAGNSSIPDLWELQGEITELRFQNQKVNDECTDLKQQVGFLQDENLLLISQKVELEKKLSQRDLAHEKVRQLHRELEETRHTITSSEDLNSVLSSRIQRLERDYGELEMKNKELKKDNDSALTDLEKCFAKLRQKDEEIETLKTSGDALAQTFLDKEKRLEDKLSHLNGALDELSNTTNQLRIDKLELESSLVDISGNQFAQLQNPSESFDYDYDEEVNQGGLHRSLHAEIVATMERKRSIAQHWLLRRRSSSALMDASTQSEEIATKDMMIETEGQRSPGSWSFREEYDQIASLMKSIRDLIFSQLRRSSSTEGEDGSVGETKEVPNNCGAEGDRVAVTGNGSVEGKLEQGGSPKTPANVGETQDEMVRRINEELAEFRQQLKNSQELFHALQHNGSSSSACVSSVTQSCPVLAEPVGSSGHHRHVLPATNLDSDSGSVEKPALVCCSTQTDPCVIDQPNQRRSSMHQDGPVRSLLDAIDDMDADGDGNYLDKLSDDISYRLTINLPTVLEESDQETETSPGAGPRRMSSVDKGSRRKLVRMPNATEDESDSTMHLGHYHIRGEDDEVSSKSDFQSANSSPPGSVYNSLERPLQINGASRNGGADSDTVSLGSDATFCSPVSSPSSPTYWTPSQGSSSQETITNPDGDRTPVNEYEPLDREEVTSVNSCPVYSSEYENGGVRKRMNSWGPQLPMYNKQSTRSIGVIPDSQKQHMINFAYDPVKRSSEEAARILTGPEWRILRKDLDKKDQDNFRKRYAQEEGNDMEGGGSAIESGSQKPFNSTDLDEEAEEFLERFPNLVEELFKHLGTIKEGGKCPTETELEGISKRFNHLAFTFQTEDITLAQRKEIKLKELETSRTRMNDTISSLASQLQELEDVSKTHKVPDEIIKLSSSLKHIVGDLSMHSTSLSKTSRRKGMMDVQIRLYKMIEVMVLYVHILRNLFDNVEKDLHNARKLLEDNKIEFSSGRHAPAQLNNNNNEKVRWDEGQHSEGELLSNEDDNGFNLEKLLGPKNLKEKMLLKEKKSSTNVVIRYIGDTYEALRCELFWPWNWEETSRGIKQLFSIILMLVGLVIILRSVFPIVSANSEPEPMVADLSSFFSKHGDMNHPKLPEV